MFNIDFDINKHFHWQSDFNGEEVGYPHIDVVGCYSYHDMSMYIDMEELQILEAWFDED